MTTQEIRQARKWAQFARDMLRSDVMAAQLDAMAAELEATAKRAYYRLAQAAYEATAAIQPSDTNMLDVVADAIRSQMDHDHWPAPVDRRRSLLTVEELDLIAAGHVAAVFWVLPSGAWDMRHVDEIPMVDLQASVQRFADYLQGQPHPDVPVEATQQPLVQPQTAEMDQAQLAAFVADGVQG